MQAEQLQWLNRSGSVATPCVHVPLHLDLGSRLCGRLPLSGEPRGFKITVTRMFVTRMLIGLVRNYHHF